MEFSAVLNPDWFQIMTGLVGAGLLLGIAYCPLPKRWQSKRFWVRKD